MNSQVETGKGNIVTDQEDRNFLKMLFIVIATLIAFFIFSIIAARTVAASTTETVSDPVVEAATIERIKPFGEVNIGKVPVATTTTTTTASTGADGKGTYTSACFACHGTGAAGAPIFGDKGAWSKRIALGMDTLNDHALNGFKGMPAKGGNASLSDAAVKAAVKYMVKGSK